MGCCWSSEALRAHDLVPPPHTHTFLPRKGGELGLETPHLFWILFPLVPAKAVTSR